MLAATMYPSHPVRVFAALLIAPLLACGDSGGSAGVVTFDGSLFDTLSVERDSGPAPSDAADTAEPDVLDVLDAVTTADSEADSAVELPDVVDAVDVADTSPNPDTTPSPVDATPDADAEVTPVVLTCPMETMDVTYSGFLPPNPYGAWPAAPDCVAQPHDVIIVLGCPSNEDGTPSTCQTNRARIARRLRDNGYGDAFIVSGGAVHNAWVEAEALRDLLISYGVAPASIHLEPQAQHTDENLYYASQIMLAEGWRSALVVSDDPGHLMMSALCDSNCCVDLGRLTLFALPVNGPAPTDNVGHYVLFPDGEPIAPAECTTIQGPLKLMCINLATRLACKDDFQL